MLASLHFLAALKPQRLSLPFVMVPFVLLLGAMFPLAGCNRLPKFEDKRPVYVVSKQVSLRDRVAAVSNHTGVVVNGQRVMVIEEGRRFLRVRTDKNEIGWLEERTVIDQKAFDGFQQLAKDHENDPVVSHATLRDALYMHLTPGRDTERFYLLQEGAKLELLERTSVEKPATPGGVGPVRRPASAAQQKQLDAKAEAQAAKSGESPKAEEPAPPPTLPREDWWLVRDEQKRYGWIVSHRLDVDLPQEIAGYSEGQRIVGAYVLRTVFDPDLNTPDHKVQEYLTVENAYKDGLPYDFDQVRIFTWNMKKHRYETAFRQRNLYGYLPVTVQAGDKPTFSLQLSINGVVKVDPATGVTRPVSWIPFNFEMDGQMVRKLTNAQIPSFKPAEDLNKKDKDKAKKKRR